MKKGLFVGARVRILWSWRWPELAGTEGRITRQVAPGTLSDTTGRPVHWEVAPDIWGRAESPCGIYKFCPNSENLEPIQPEGAQPCGRCLAEVLSDLQGVAVPA